MLVEFPKPSVTPKMQRQTPCPGLSTCCLSHAPLTRPSWVTLEQVFNLLVSHEFPHLNPISQAELLHVNAWLFSLWLFYITSKSAQKKILEGSPCLSFSWLLVKQEHLLELGPWPPPEEHADHLTHPFRKLKATASQPSRDTQVQRVGGTPAQSHEPIRFCPVIPEPQEEPNLRTWTCSFRQRILWEGHSRVLIHSDLLFSSVFSTRKYRQDWNVFLWLEQCLACNNFQSIDAKK